MHAKKIYKTLRLLFINYLICVSSGPFNNSFLFNLQFIIFFTKWQIKKNLNNYTSEEKDFWKSLNGKSRDKSRTDAPDCSCQVYWVALGARPAIPQ